MLGLEKNEGDMDRAARVVIGVVLVALAYLKFVSAPIDLVLYVVGAVLVLTGITGFCAIYKLFGINTAKPSK